MLHDAQKSALVRQKNEPSWSQLELTPPDYREQRDDRRLLVWGDLPHWMVVDHEFDELLAQFHGHSDTVAHTLAGLSATERNAITSQLVELHRIGVLREAGDGQSGNPKQNDAPTRIENISVNLTRRCNLRCSFCYYLEDLGVRCDDELTAREIIAFLKAARPLLAAKPSLALLGGEPTLCSDKLLEVARYALKAGFTLLLSTNGTMITPEFAAAARRMRLQVQVSLDDYEAAGHDAGRGAGTFARALDGIKTLVAANVHTILSMVCHAENLERVEGYYAFARSIGVNEARFIPLKRIGGAKQTGPEPAPVCEIIARTVRMLERHPEYLSLMGRDCFSILGSTCRLASRRRSCGVGSQTVLLDADGALYPCLNTNREQFRIGNIRDPGFDFPELWRGSTVLHDVREQTDIDRSDEACSRCFVRYWCLGNCRGETHALTHRLSGPSHACRDMRRAWLDMMWITAEHPEWIVTTQTAC